LIQALLLKRSPRLKICRHGAVQAGPPTATLAEDTGSKQSAAGISISISISNSDNSHNGAVLDRSMALPGHAEACLCIFLARSSGRPAAVTYTVVAATRIAISPSQGLPPALRARGVPVAVSAATRIAISPSRGLPPSATTCGNEQLPAASSSSSSSSWYSQYSS